MNFDEIINRESIPVLKLDSESMKNIFGRDDIWPAWVADMNFASAPAIISAAVKRAELGFFGYEYLSDSVRQAVVDWHQKRHHWVFEKGHILFSPSVLNSLASLVLNFTNEGDGVIIQPPVFFDFKLILLNNKRRVVTNPLIFEHGRYRFDFDDLSQKAADKNVKMLILCNPHNPIGRVWSEQELKRIAEICRDNNILVVADEIHADITFEKFTYTPFAKVAEPFSVKTISCISPAKSFNVAGAVNSMMVVADDELRESIATYYNHHEINKNNAFANVIMQAAYSQGEEWLEQVIVYIEDNLNYLRQRIEQDIPGVELVEPEGTFLVWLDFRSLGFEPKQLHQFLVDKAGLALNAGHWFGREGAGFSRLNIACPRSELKHALDSLSAAVAVA